MGMTDVGVHVLPQPVEHRTYYTLARVTPVLVHNAGSDRIPGYENHDPQGGPNPYDSKEGVLSAEAAERFQNRTLLDGVRWTKIGSGKKAFYYRYSSDGCGNGIGVKVLMALMVEGNSVEIPLNHIPIRIRRR